MNLSKNMNQDELSMKNYVFKVLKESIMKLKLEPGEILRKKDIANELQVSRTPIREAFVKLAGEGLIDIYPQRGTSVSYIDLNKVAEAKFMREHLEKPIVKLACKDLTKEYLMELETNIKLQEVAFENSNYIKLFELDNDFHKILFEGCQKSNVWSAIQQMGTHLNRIRVLSLAADFNRNDVIKDHEQIVKALEEKDINRAEEIMGKHVTRIQFDKNKLKKEYPSYFKN